MRMHIRLMICSILVSLCTCIFYKYTSIQFETEVPFGLETSVTKFEITNRQAPSIEQTAETLNEIKKLTYINSMLLIAQIYELEPLYVWDPLSFYKQYPLVSGKYLEFSTNGMLVKNDSFYHKYSLLNSEHKDITGDYVLAGVYDDDHPLFTSAKSRILNFFTAPELDGIYYLQSDNNEYISNFSEIFSRNGYSVSTARVSKTLLDVLSNSTYVIAAIGLVLLFSNLSLFFRFYILKHESMLFIHHFFGASKFQTYVLIQKSALLPILVASIIGVAIYRLLFIYSLLEMSLGALLCALLIAIVFQEIFIGLTYSLFSLKGRLRRN